MPPIRFPREALHDRQGLKTRRIGPTPTDGWTEPVFMEWELTRQSWTDQHPHAEYVFVLEGCLVVESDGVTVECRAGDLVAVPAGSCGTYSAPDHARMISVYGANPDAKETKILGLKAL